MRRWAGVALLAGVTFAAGGAGARQTERAWRDYDGREWVGIAPREQQAFVSGFLAGAGLAEVEAATGGDADSARLHGVVDSLARSGGLRFAHGSTVYATRLNEFYWWENHVPVRLYLALRQINQGMRSGEEQ